MIKPVTIRTISDEYVQHMVKVSNIMQKETVVPVHTLKAYIGNRCIYQHVFNRSTRQRSRVRFSMLSLEFFIDIILPAALWPWD